MAALLADTGRFRSMQRWFSNRLYSSYMVQKFKDADAVL